MKTIEKRNKPAISEIKVLTPISFKSFFKVKRLIKFHLLNFKNCQTGQKSAKILRRKINVITTEGAPQAKQG